MGNNICCDEKHDEREIEIKTTKSNERQIDSLSISHIVNKKFTNFIRESFLKNEVEIDLDESKSKVNSNNMKYKSFYFELNKIA